MDSEILLNERVEVIARFSSAYKPCVPVKFRRPNGREVTVAELGLAYHQNRGASLIHIFDITDGSADYRLELNATTLVWRLVREASYGE